MAAPTSNNEVTVRRLTRLLTGSDGNGGLWGKVKDKISSSINALDVSSVGGAGKYISAISETDGKISATATTMDTSPTASSTNAVTSGGVKTALDGKLNTSGGAMTGAITRDLGSGVISDTNLLTITGSTDGFKVDYGAATSDAGVTKIYTTDDANAKISIGNYNSSYKEAIGITNGSAALSNTPTAPTAAAGTNTTQIATTAFVNTAITNGQYIIPDAYCDTAAGTAAKTAKCAGFALSSHQNIPFRIQFTTANSSAGQLTLSLNGTTAKNLYINGSNSSASNYTIPAGVYWCMYDGYEYLLSTTKTSPDGKFLAKNGDFRQPQEAYLAWGGQNITGSYGPIDAAMVPQLGANRFSNLWKGVSVEYTRDGGTTWIDYGLTDADKRTFFTKTYSLVIGKADSTNKATTAENYSKYKLRITLDKTAGTNVYTELRKFILDVSTAGSSSCYMILTGEYRSGDNYVWKTLGEMALNGWNGYNVFNTYFTFGNYGDTVSSGQYRKLVFLFETRAAGNTSYNGLSIRSIYAYGGVGWTTPSIMASTGHLYNYDGDQNATFPALVTATKFVGPLMGNADTATKADYLTGFTSRSNTISWGTLTSANGYTCVTDLAYRTGSQDTGNIAFGYKAGSGSSYELSCQIDGYFYQRTGSKRVMDVSDINSSFYAPTGAGTSGQLLKSSGSGAPTWATANAALVGITVTSTSVSDGTNTFNKYTHPTYTAQTSKGSATKVPQITTDSTGHVTGITEVTITGVTPASHTHGNITNGGALQTNDVTIASGDKLVITDSSDSSKVARASISFDGSTATKALTQKGTWETFNNYTHPSYTATTAAAKKIGCDATGHVVFGDALAKSDVGLGSVVNTGDSATPVSGGTTKFTTGGAYTELAKKANKADSVYYVAATFPMDAYSSSKTYSKWTSGAYTSANSCVYNNYAYYCNTAITTAEAWNSAHWTRIATTTWNGTIDGVTEITAGLKIAIKLPGYGGSSSTKLNINGLGEKDFRYNTSGYTTHYSPGLVVFAAYNGSYWGIPDYNSDSWVTSMGGYCSTAAATQEKGVTSSNTVLTAGMAMLVRFTNANSYDGKITMNVNSQGAKDIWINGAVSSSSNKTLPAGEHWCFYDGSKWSIWTNGTVQFKGVHADSYEAKYILNANEAIPPYVTTGSIGGAFADFVAPSHASNIPSSSYNWHIHAIIFRNGTNYRLTQIATASTSSAVSLTYERNAWSSDGTTWTFASAWTEILTSNSTISASKVSGTVGAATKATQDGSGNTITSTYATKATAVTAVTWDNTNKKLTRTINGTAADVFTITGSGNTTVTSSNNTITISSSDTYTGTVTSVKVGSTSYSPTSGVVSLPAYPTVNNATLTIQSNGSNVTTFTANASSNVTANIPDTKVTQTNTDTSSNAQYRILMSATADDTTRTEGARKSTYAWFNPSTQTLGSQKFNVAGACTMQYNASTSAIDFVFS